MDPQAEPMNYICGDYGMENTLKCSNVIQCRECGYHILYKKRTRHKKEKMDPQTEPVNYICGDYGMENTLKYSNVIQCGYHILYKKHTL
ncbi:hypothetical protein Ahy_A03g013308 [Arachis hypogaea]|uniref:Uncharacterized protein n=1 Tax=Arachis hypogaea TaxID=3818 RepID=A0A445DVB1_ARAHY|nr:hypothetical protein Ahy_A03g013308 [Arachis hypogaea]